MADIKFPDAREANRRYGQVFITLAQRSVDTITFRQLCELGLPHAETHLQHRNASSVHQMAQNGDLDKFFISRDHALNHFGGIGGMASTMTRSQIAAYQRSVDMASLVFAHSAVDAAASELCWITAFAKPDAWVQFVENKKVSLAETRTSSPEQLFGRSLADHLSQFEKESLLKRADRLFALCRPRREWESLRGFKYDRTRLEQLDLLRHRIVHHDVQPDELTKMDSDSKYLFDVGMHLWGMVNEEFHVKIDVRDLLPPAVQEALGAFVPDAS